MRSRSLSLTILPAIDTVAASQWDDSKERL